MLFAFHKSYSCAVRATKHLFLSHRKCHFKSSEIVPLNDYLWGTDFSVVGLVNKYFTVYNDFISEYEESELLKEIEPIFKRRRYEFDHWDGAIQGYKETDKLDWNEINTKVMEKLQEVAFPHESAVIKQVHVLDLSQAGHIKPHIDSVRFCGDTIAGISLLSSCVMRLAMEQNNKLPVDVLLQRRSLYIMKGDVRYNFTHEILKDAESVFKDKRVPRERRISVICRNEPKEDVK